MCSRTTATDSSSRVPAPLLLAAILTVAMVFAPAVTVEARGVRESGGAGESAPPATGSPGSDTGPAPERESGQPATDPATFTDELVEAPCPCSGPEATEAAPFSVLASGANAAQQNRLAARAASQEELENLWARVARTRIPPPEPPGVRFGSQTVVAIFMGQQPSGGYSIEVDAACRTDANGVVHLCYIAVEPPEDAIVTMALTSPYAFVVIEEPAVEVVVHRRVRTH